MKKFLLALLCSVVPAAQAVNFYPIFDAFGSLTDFFVSKSNLTEEDERLFNEIAASYGIDHRQIKARNSGLLLRLICGYNNALANQLTNRVYFNAACLLKMTEGQKRFLMGHELAHHKKNHHFKFTLVDLVKKGLRAIICSLTQPSSVYVQGNSPLYLRYFAEGFQFGVDFSLLGLIDAQIHQRCETEADEISIESAGTTLDDSDAVLESLYCPDTKDWPLYARIYAMLAKLLIPIMNLPVIKQHVPHLASKTERIQHLHEVAA